MTEPRAKCWFRQRLKFGAAAGLSSAAMLPPSRLLQLSEPGDDSNFGQIGLIIAIAAAVIVGLVLIAHLVRPLLGRASSEQPAEPDQIANDHEERWAQWEAGNAVTTPKPTEQQVIASQQGEDMVIGSLPSIEVPPDQASSSSEISPSGAIGASIYATVSALLDCANDGAMLSGFGLYSDSFFHRFAVESGLLLDEFVRRYQSQGTRQEGDRLYVDRIDSMINLPDGRVSARIQYGPAGILPPERYIFAWFSERNRWLIDDIQAEG